MAKTIGRLQSGNPESLEFTAYGFSGGLNVQSPPQLIGDEDLQQALNGYVEPSGGFRMRNGMAKQGVTLGTGGPVINARFYQAVRNGAAVTAVSQLLGQYLGNLYIVGASSNTLIGSVGGTTASAMTFVRFADPNNPNYTSGITDVIVICTGSGGPYVYDGVNLYTPSGWSAAASASWVAAVNGILWFGGIPATPNQIFGSGDGIIASVESLPAYRNFVMTAPVSGLCAQGTGATATLVIGRNSGFSVLYGTGPSTFYLQDIPFQDGVVSGRSMISANGVVYALGRNAYYSFDGQTIPKRLTDKVEPWVLNDPFVLGYPMTQARRLTWSCVYNNRVHLGYCSASTTPNTILVYDLNTLSWTVLQTTPGLASMILLDAPTDPHPYVAIAGSATTGQSYVWDYVPTTTSSPATDDGIAVTALAQSKSFFLGDPGTTKALQRAYPDIYVSGPTMFSFLLSVDVGNILAQSLVDTGDLTGGALEWDNGLWDAATWASTASTGFTRFGAPFTRCDFAGVQGDTFSFGLTNSGAAPPWIFVGGLGVYNQRGLT